jgi:hypothetical protein
MEVTVPPLLFCMVAQPLLEKRIRLHKRYQTNLKPMRHGNVGVVINPLLLRSTLMTCTA